MGRAVGYLNAPGVMRRRFGGNKLSYCGQRGFRGRITKNYGTRIKLYTTPFVLVMKVTHGNTP